MRAWAHRAATAAGLAAESAALWVPGALAWLVSVGWLPFVLVVVPLPSEGDLVVFGASLATSGAWPWNLVALASGGMAVVLLGLLLLSAAEVALLGAVMPGPRAAYPAAATLRDVAAHFFLRIAAALPVAIALAVVLVALAGVAPGEFQSPDIGGLSYARIAARLLGPLALLVLALTAATLLVAIAARRAPPGGRRPLAELRAAAPELRRRPLAAVGLALATLLAGAAYLLGVYLLLRVLWAPLADVLTGGQPIEAGDLLLLVGFVAIWLCLILAGGALHAWASVWWTLEVAAVRHDEAGRASATAEGPRTA